MSDKVYKTEDGSLCFAACAAGRRLVRNLPASDIRGCPTFGCACGIDAMRFRAATEADAEAFWRSMSAAADEALYEIEHGL